MLEHDGINLVALSARGVKKRREDRRGFITAAATEFDGFGEHFFCFVVLVLVVKKFAQVSENLELIGTRREHPPHTFLRFLRASLVEMHASVHPLTAYRCRIQIDAAVVGGFGEIQQAGVVIEVSEQIPSGLRVWRQYNSLP